MDEEENGAYPLDTITLDLIDAALEQFHRNCPSCACNGKEDI